MTCLVSVARQRAVGDGVEGQDGGAGVVGVGAGDMQLDRAHIRAGFWCLTCTVAPGWARSKSMAAVPVPETAVGGLRRLRMGAKAAFQVIFSSQARTAGVRRPDRGYSKTRCRVSSLLPAFSEYRQRLICLLFHSRKTLCQETALSDELNTKTAHFS